MNDQSRAQYEDALILLNEKKEIAKVDAYLERRGKGRSVASRSHPR